ncbi:hypothetical protein ACFLZ5_03880 [Thermodesulfobacteriota bacterium]
MNCDGLQIFRMLVFAVFFICIPGFAPAASVPVAVFPLQELGEGRNDANLEFTRILTEKLSQGGNEIIDIETVIAFMANNRIRTVGHLEALNISRVRRDLGAGFILLGTISQLKEKPEPSMGLVLSLVRTSDIRVIWSYVSSLSTGEERRVLGIGEPQSTAELSLMILEDIIGQWPWQTINEEPQIGSLNIDLAVLEPQYVRPGDEVHSRVRLRHTWPSGQGPRVFFKADNQIYPATSDPDGLTYETTWVAGEENGRFQVTLLLEWPYYGRAETTLIGNYIVDGTPPLFEIELQGTRLINNIPVFSRQVVIRPRMIIRKPLSRWRFAIYYDGASPIGEMNGIGNLPQTFTWSGRASEEDGIYEVVVEAWDKAGNSVKVSKEVGLNTSLPQVDIALDRSGKELILDLEHDDKVPLQYWRLEMWTREGKILTQAEGKDLPVTIGIELPESVQEHEIQGRLFYEDVLGKRVQKKLQDILPKLDKKAVPKEEETKGISKKWVDEF